MLVYRTSRAPERRVFKVFVGNMDDKDVEAYIQKVANKFKRDPVVDPNNGNVDLRMNQMAVDQDYFIPVRDQAAPSPIDTLPGATNLSEIADIEYIQKKLLASLRIPKAFLGFEEVVGEGKNLALLDIRFARTNTLTRPNYTDIIPLQYWSGVGRTVDYRNSFLEPGKSANIDFNISVNQNHLGLLSFGYFQKNIDEL